MYHSQSGQDQFVLFCLNRKRNGTFVEIGSFDPVEINNTFVLENDFQWSGLMIERDPSFLPKYQKLRPKSHHLIQDATTVRFDKEFAKLGLPSVIDYVMVDLDVSSQATIRCLRKLDNEVMGNYKFAVVTFEHDIYRHNFINWHKYFFTRSKSRQIFKKHGYVRAFSDVRNVNNPFEDWYVHPDCVDMNRIKPLMSNESLEWTDIVRKFQESAGENAS